MREPAADERRAAPRFTLDVTATVATHCEQPVRDARAVNASATGVLIVFQGPVVPFRPGDRCLVSLLLAGGALHVLGRVRRRDPGADHGQYVGIEFDDRLSGADLAHVTQEAAESRSG